MQDRSSFDDIPWLAEESPLDDDAMRTAVAMLLHELRNGHNGIHGVVRMLCRELPADAVTASRARLLMTLCEQQVGFLDDLLLLARTRTHPLRIHPQAFNVHTLVEQVCLQHADTALAKGLMLGRVIEPGVPQACKADAQRLRQVLGNLMANAVQHTRAGAVSLCVRTAPGSRSDGIALCFEVSDTGTGLTDGALAMLGRLFERLDSDETAPHGSGLGIAVARRLVQAMGGTLDIDSAPGKGTRATVNLPVSPVSPDTVRRTPPGDVEAWATDEGGRPQGWSGIGF